MVEKCTASKSIEIIWCCASRKHGSAGLLVIAVSMWRPLKAASRNDGHSAYHHQHHSKCGLIRGSKSVTTSIRSEQTSINKTLHCESPHFAYDTYEFTPFF